MPTMPAGTGSRWSNASRAWRALAALAVVFGAQAWFPLSRADASVVVGVVPAYPEQVDVGATNVPASITIVNRSDGLQNGPVTVTELLLLPSCSNQNPNCEGGGADPGTFEVSSTGQGAAGTSCAGRPFAVRVVDQSTGRVRFIPADNGTLVLGAADATTERDTCRIDFTFAVRQAPTIDSSPQVQGVQTNQVGWMVAMHADRSVGFDQGDDVTTVNSSPPPSPNVLCVILALLGLC